MLKKKEKKLSLMEKLERLTSNDKRKIKTLVETKGFEYTINCLILFDAIILGMLTFLNENANLLFLLDRLFVGVFMVEMILKIITHKTKFFKSGWNVFDFIVISISTNPFMSSFIILRIFRVFKYIDKKSILDDVFEVFLQILIPFFSLAAIMSVIFYIYAILGISLYGTLFNEFASLGSTLFLLLQTLTFNDWAASIATSVRQIFPYSWIYFVSFLIINFLFITSFLVAIIKNPKIKAT